MASNPEPEWITPGLWGALGAAVTGTLAYLGVRFTAKKNPAVDPQAAQLNGWDDLLNQMRLELRAAKRERTELREAITEERAGWALERQEYIDQIAQLQQIARSFESLLRRAIAGEKITLPERKPHEPIQPEVVQATLRQEGLGDAD